MVFVDYLTKWVEAYPTADQTSETITRLLIDHIICRYSVHAGLLSDHGANLLSFLVMDLCELSGMKKVNTTASHPQTENVNCMISAMIAKCAHKFEGELDRYLQQLWFAYRIKPYDSSSESAFYLLYGSDKCYPTETALSQLLLLYKVDIDDYHLAVTLGLTEAWSWPKETKDPDKKARVIWLKMEDRVMVFMPSETTGKHEVGVTVKCK